jgi:antitoxin (DNA-binding transcriptional repressor) of toxin-antitoxin stability system
MKAVGIKQLKSHLSDYVRLAKGGETVLVTEREEVVAELRPARRFPPPSVGLEGVLDALAEGGEIERASLSKDKWRWKTRGLGLSPRTVARILDELREDR